MPDRAAADGCRASVWMVFLVASYGSAGAEGDDAPDRIVRGYPNGHPIARHHLYAEPAHSTTELREHLVAGIALDAVEAAAMDRHDRSLHINQIVLAQFAVRSPRTNIVPHLALPMGLGRKLFVYKRLTASST
jgi:hypothetical protein